MSIDPAIEQIALDRRDLPRGIVQSNLLRMPVPTIAFDLLYAFVVVRLDRRDLVWTNVTANPTAEWVAHQITKAFPWDEAPHYLIRDRDRIYGSIVTRRLRAMGIRDKPTAPASPWQNGFAERLSDRSGVSVWITSSFWARHISAGFLVFATRTRRLLGLFSDPFITSDASLAASLPILPGLDFRHTQYCARTRGGHADTGSGHGGTLVSPRLRAFVASGAPVLAEVVGMIEATPIDGFAACAYALQDYDFSPDLVRLRVPTLLVVGDEDGVLPATMRTLRPQIAGAGFAEIPKAGHLSNMEQPGAFLQAVTPFLDRITAESESRA